MAAESQEAPAQADHQVPQYRVAAVERMTHIPASTLRSWERRYGWPEPLRTPSGQRLYSDQDMAVIRFLDRRRVEGMSLSQAAGLLSSAPDAEDHDPGRLLARLVDALRAYDEAEAERAFATAEALLGVEGVACGLVPAAIVAASAHGPGRDRPPVEVEHFASNLLRRQTLPESLERALEWMRDSRRWSRHTLASWWAGPAVADAPDLAARLPGGLLEGSVDQGAAAVDATLARRH
jgi:DNA-binding transcriptional MerR regulator